MKFSARIEQLSRFVLLLLKVPVNSYGHVETVTSDFVSLLPDIEMNDKIFLVNV